MFGLSKRKELEEKRKELEEKRQELEELRKRLDDLTKLVRSQQQALDKLQRTVRMQESVISLSRMKINKRIGLISSDVKENTMKIIMLDKTVGNMHVDGEKIEQIRETMVRLSKKKNKDQVRKKIDRVPVKEMWPDMPIRISKSFDSAGIKCIGDLLKYSRHDLMKLERVGVLSVRQIEVFVYSLGLELKMEEV